MTTDIPLEASPADRIALAVETLGEADVIDRAKALLAGLNAGEEFLLWVGGTHAQGILDGAPALYWPEVWGARAFLTVWNESAAPGIEAALTNQAWRVREMCAKVVALRELPFSEFLTPMLTDDVPRVRAAAARALGQVATFEDAAIIKNLLKDSEIDVRRAAGESLKVVADRFGRPVE